MTSIDVFGLGMPRWRWYAAIAMSASCWVTVRYARIFHSTRLAVSLNSVITVGMVMVLALSVGGGWYFHSRKVSSTAFCIEEVAHG